LNVFALKIKVFFFQNLQKPNVLNKRSCLAPALGVAKFTNIIDIILSQFGLHDIQHNDTQHEGLFATLSIKGFFATFSINDIQHNSTSAVMLNVEIY
jgi:hypothetical protein